MYRTIDAQIYDDPKVRQLGIEGKLLLLYLITNRHSHVSGIYYLPDCLVLHETDISQKKLDTLWDTLSSLRLAYRDRVNEVIWVRKMMFYQGRGDKNVRSAAVQIKSLHQTPLIKDFIEEYPAIKKYGIVYPIQPQDEVRTQYQEQEQDKEQDINTLASPDKNPVQQEAVFTLPTCRQNESFPVTQISIDEWHKLYPDVDIPAEIRKMIGWLNTHPKKTPKGMPKFMNYWLSCAQDRSRGNGTKPNPPDILQTMLMEAEQERINAKSTGN